MPRIPVLLPPLTLALALTWAQPASAEVRRLLIDRQESLPAQPGEGLPAYVRVRGRLVGELDPNSRSNALIQDIERAPRNARGHIEYVSTFTLFMPADAHDSNGVLLDQIPNRGSRSTAFGGDEAALTFLRRRGYSVVWVGWQGDLPEKPSVHGPAISDKIESLLAPSAKGIVGPYLVRVPVTTGPGPSGDILPIDQGNAGPLAYFPASYDNRGSTLTGGAPETPEGAPSGRRYSIPSADWTWWNCKSQKPAETAASPADLCVKRLSGAFNPSESYTLVFPVKDPIVLGVGLAATRDAVSFFRRKGVDVAGTPNPLAGRVRHVIGAGVSQVGNFVKTFVLLGFNRDETGLQVWDGASAHIAGRLVPLNIRFAMPGGSAVLYQPGNEGFLWWGKSRSVRGQVGSMLDRCSASDTCPLIFETFGGSELWNQRISTGLATSDLTRDIPLPTNVRRYFFPGTTHGGGGGGFSLSGASSDRGVCTLAPNPNPEDAQMRALFVALTDWVVKGAEPPPSRYPSLAAGTLVRDQPGSLHPQPFAPGVSPYGLANPMLVYDYGPRFNYRDMSGVIDAVPPAIRGSVPALVPQVDADGNEVGGVNSVLLDAPLGSYLSWNTYRAGPYAGRICSFQGGYIPFAKTKADRDAVGDSRLSIQERYGSRSGYIAAVRRAVSRAVSGGFLLTEDSEAIVAAAINGVEAPEFSFLESTP